MARAHTTGICAHTWVPWSGMMVKRTTPDSRRIQHTLPSDDRDAVSSVAVSLCFLYLGQECIMPTGEDESVEKLCAEPHCCNWRVVVV